MNDEKKMILKMLEEGKITSEEAARLIEALEEKEEPQYKRYSNNFSKSKNFQDEIYKIRDRLNDWKKDFKSNYNQKDFDQMVDDFSIKAEKLGKNITSTTVNIVDRMVDFVGSFVDTNAFNSFGSYKANIKTFSFPYSENLSLDITGINGGIFVKTHNEESIKIESKTRAAGNYTESFIELEEIDNVKKIKFNNKNNIPLSVSYEVFVPQKKIDSLNIKTLNGKIYLEDVISDTIDCTTKNNPIEIMGIKTKNLYSSTKNSKINISYVMGEKINIDANNAVIEIKHLKTDTLTAMTANGKINIENVQNYQDIKDLNMNLKTKNANIKINMNDVNEKGYKIKALTTLNGINLLIPKLKYKTLNKEVNDGNLVEAETENYTLSKERVNINTENKNGYIEIVK
jgi:DUF4097 and DUF4098 domain-containing protein YvlB